MVQLVQTCCDSDPMLALMEYANHGFVFSLFPEIRFPLKISKLLHCLFMLTHFRAIFFNSDLKTYLTDLAEEPWPLNQLISISNIAKMLADISAGMDYLHSEHQMVHRDLAAR